MGLSILLLLAGSAVRFSAYSIVSHVLRIHPLVSNLKIVYNGSRGQHSGKNKKNFARKGAVKGFREWIHQIPCRHLKRMHYKSIILCCACQVSIAI